MKAWRKGQAAEQSIQKPETPRTVEKGKGGKYSGLSAERKEQDGKPALKEWRGWD